MHLCQCFTTGVPWNVRVPRVAARGSASGCQGFREWLPGVPPKQTEIAWDEIRNHSSVRL